MSKRGRKRVDPGHPSPFHPRTRAVPVAMLEIPYDDLRKIGLTDFAPLVSLTEMPVASTDVPRGPSKPVPTANITMEHPMFNGKNLPEWAERFAGFLFLIGQMNACVTILNVHESSPVCLAPFSFTNRGSLSLCVYRFVENLLCFCEAACRSFAPRLRVRRLGPRPRSFGIWGGRAGAGHQPDVA